MKHLRRSCRRSLTMKGNSKLVLPSVKEMPPKGRSKLTNSCISSSSSVHYEEKNQGLDLKFICVDDIENCAEMTVTTCRRGMDSESSSDEFHVDYVKQIDEQRQESENEADSEQSDTSTDNMIFICHSSMVSEESSPLSFSPRMSAHMKNDENFENGKLARRLFKTSGDLTSRVVARRSSKDLETKNEIDAKKPWKCFESPWDFGLQFQLNMDFGANEAVAQRLSTSLIDSHRTSMECDGDTKNTRSDSSHSATNAENHHFSSFRDKVVTASDALVVVEIRNNQNSAVPHGVVGPMNTIAYGCNPYCWTFPPAFHWTGYTDSFYGNHLYPFGSRHTGAYNFYSHVPRPYCYSHQC